MAFYKVFESNKAQCSKIGKNAISKVLKYIFCYFKNGKKSILAPEKSLKTTKNAIFGLFSGAKIDFSPFMKIQIMCFCSFEIALFSIFRELCTVE